MKITQSTVPGGGVLHEIVSRGGEAFRILVEPNGDRVIVIEDPDDPDQALVEILLESDEADAIADILHSAPIVDRVASLERRLEEHLHERRGGPGAVGPPGSR